MPRQESNKKNIGVILLAAGKSSRLGHPKQLLFYADQTLLRHSLQIASASTAHPIVVVLGAHANTVKGEIDGVDIEIVVNDNWQEGMASSIQCGVKTLLKKSPSAEGAIVMVCDQPYVTSTLLNNLMITYQETGKPIVASGYENTFGPPVFFQKTLFPELLQLKGDVGAKRVITQHANEVEVVLFPGGNTDIDTEADHQNLLKGNIRP